MTAEMASQKRERWITLSVAHASGVGPYFAAGLAHRRSGSKSSSSSFTSQGRS